MPRTAFNPGPPFAARIYGVPIISPRFVTARRGTCAIRATATPPRRTIALSTLAATSALSAVTGGPSLVAWSAMFGAVGLVTEVPVGLIGVAAGICAGLADLIAIDIGRSAFDTGTLPFIVFAVGTTVAGFMEVADGPFTKPAVREGERPVEIDQGNNSEDSGDVGLTAWDKALEKRDAKGGD